eukprot:Ihof_evm5s437 gene=Ihof_evmTU5s437
MTTAHDVLKDFDWDLLDPVEMLAMPTPMPTDIPQSLNSHMPIDYLYTVEN